MLTTAAIPNVISTSHLTREVVERCLDADESFGFAVAVFRLSRTQRAWQPNPNLPHLTGPGIVRYERWNGQTTCTKGWE